MRGIGSRVPPYTGARPVVALGDSNTAQSYLSATPADRWAAMVGARNWGRDGAVTADYLGTGPHVASAAVSQWRIDHPATVIACFGLNESTPAELEASTRVLHRWVRGVGARLILLTNVAVDFAGGKYSWDRNPAIEAMADVYRDLALELDGVTLADAFAAFELEIAGGTWDHRIRANQTTFDASLDASQPEPWASDGSPASWWTDIHLNAAGSTVVADVLTPLL